MKHLAIIGFGQFGQLAADLLRARYHIAVHDSHVSEPDIRAAGCEPLSLIEAAKCDIVVVAVPVQVMESVIAAIGPHVRPGALVADVASVKMLPSQWLATHIPDHADIVATHPLFGPQSVLRGVEGRQFVICPIRGERHLRVAQIGEEMGLRVRITTAEEHDREMAYVQALTHLIGRTLVQMNIPDEKMKTQTYQHLLDLTGLIGGDSFELFTAIQTMNPFARPVVEDFVSKAEDLLTKMRALTAN